LRMILTEGGVLLLAGTTAGLVLAFATAKLIASQMYGISEGDPVSFITVSVTLATISLLTCTIAAVRALKIDPIVALRCE